MNTQSGKLGALKFEPYKGNEDYIFISYCREDSERVNKIVSVLHEKGYRIWHDGAIQAGEDYLSTLGTKIENCKVFIAFLSENYVMHKNCTDELFQVFKVLDENCKTNRIQVSECKRPVIIPIMLKKFQLPRNIELLIGSINYISVSGKSVRGFAEAFYRTNEGILKSCLSDNPPSPPQRKWWEEFTDKKLWILVIVIVAIIAVCILVLRKPKPVESAVNNPVEDVAEINSEKAVIVPEEQSEKEAATEYIENVEPQEETGRVTVIDEEATIESAAFKDYEEKLEAKSSALKYLDGRRQDTGTPPATYEAAEQALSCASNTYDNAMIALAFQSEGDYESSAIILDALTEGLKNDVEFKDRFRNAYMAGDPTSLPGWWDDEAGRWCQDPYQVGTSIQATCAAAMALLRYNSVKPNAEYVNAASTAVSWILKNCKDSTPGFTSGYDGWPNNNAATVYTYKSTTDNIWLYVACRLLHEETGLDMFAQAAESAKEFITEKMYSVGDSRFYSGTESDGKTPRVDNVVVSAQALAELALKDDSGLDNIKPQDDGGYPYFKTSSPGSWVEGTAMAALAFLEAGENQRYQDTVDALAGFQLSSGGFPQATVPALETGEKGLIYSDIPETAPCAWFIMAVNGFNPMQ